MSIGSGVGIILGAGIATGNCSVDKEGSFIVRFVFLDFFFILYSTDIKYNFCTQTLTMVEIYLPEYTWKLVKDFLFHRKHPTAFLLERFCLRYHRPQIFMSGFYKMRDGMYVKMSKPCLQIIPTSLETTVMSFRTYMKVKRLR
jgi:hypothetical protein